MVVLKRLGVMSVARIQAIIGAVIGLFYGVINALCSLFPACQLTVVAGVLSIFIFPIFFAISGFIGGAIGAYLYNLVAKRFGGIEFEFHGERR